MKIYFLFLILLSVVLGQLPKRESELYYETGCRGDWLSLSCVGRGFIRIYNSSFGVSKNASFCDPNSTYCDVPTVNSTFHDQIRTCDDKSVCPVLALFGLEKGVVCDKLLNVAKVTYCCVSQPGFLCQGQETTSSPWTPFPPETGTVTPNTTTSAPPWISPNTTAHDLTTQTIPPGGDNTALIAGIVVGLLAGGIIIAAVIVIIVKKCRHKPDSVKKHNTNNIPAANKDTPSVNSVHPKPPGVYYVKPERDQDSHHYQSIDRNNWTTPPYYNVYNQYEYIDDENDSIRENTDNDSQYEEVGNAYLGLYNGSTI